MRTRSITTNGINTGICNISANYCSIYAWCQPEPPTANAPPSNYLYGVENFTIFIRVTVHFPTFGVTIDNANGSSPTPNYNLFTVGDLLQSADTSIEEIRQPGCTIAVIINWDCNFDHNPSQCVPEFTLVRLDSQTGSDSSSSGFNFRYANYYYLSNETTAALYRDLYKVYGIRFIFLLSGQAGKFDIGTSH